MDDIATYVIVFVIFVTMVRDWFLLFFFVLCFDSDVLTSTLYLEKVCCAHQTMITCYVLWTDPVCATTLNIK